MTSAEHKAMREEINRQIIKHDEKYSKDFDAMVLWALHTCFGFGKERLKKFWDCLIKEHKRLREYYKLPP